MKYSEIKFIFDKCEEEGCDCKMTFTFNRINYIFERTINGFSVETEDHDEDYSQRPVSVEQLLEDKAIDDFEFSFKEAYDNILNLKITPEYGKLFQYIRKFKRKQQDNCGRILYKIKSTNYQSMESDDIEIIIYDNLSKKNNLLIIKNDKKTKKTIDEENINKIKNLLEEFKLEGISSYIKSNIPIESSYQIEANYIDTETNKKINKHIIAHNLFYYDNSQNVLDSQKLYYLNLVIIKIILDSGINKKFLNIKQFDEIINDKLSEEDITEIINNFTKKEEE